MAVLVGYQALGADPKMRTVIEELVTQLQAGLAAMPVIQTGMIIPWGGSITPSGYLLCDGAAYMRTDYPQLFAVIGTSFGTGNGSTTFNVPNDPLAVPTIIKT